MKKKNKKKFFFLHCEFYLKNKYTYTIQMFCMSYNCFTVLHVLWPGSWNHLWNGLMFLSLFFCFTDHISLVFRRLQAQFASRCQQNMSITNSLHFPYFFPIFFFFSEVQAQCLAGIVVFSIKHLQNTKTYNCIVTKHHHLLRCILLSIL